MARRTVKTGRLPLLLVVLLLLSLDHGGILCQGHGGRGECSAVEKEVTGLQIAENIHQVTGRENTRVYVAPKPGFTGVNVKIQDGHSYYHDFWFPLDRNCFPRTYDWWELSVTTRNYRGKETQGLRCGVLTGECFKVCSWPVVPDSTYGLTVVAYGPSEWRVTPPPAQCSTKEAGSRPTQGVQSICTRPPNYTTTRPPSGRQSWAIPRPVHRPQTPGTPPPPPPSRRPTPLTTTTTTAATTTTPTTATSPAPPAWDMSGCHERVEAGTALLMMMVMVTVMVAAVVSVAVVGMAVLVVRKTNQLNNLNKASAN